MVGFSFFLCGATAVVLCIQMTTAGATESRKCFQCSSIGIGDIKNQAKLLGLQKIPDEHLFCYLPFKLGFISDVPTVSCNSSCVELFMEIPSFSDGIIIRGCQDQLTKDKMVKQVSDSCEEGPFRVPGFPDSEIQQRLCSSDLCNKNVNPEPTCTGGAPEVSCDYCSAVGNSYVDCSSNQKCIGNWCVDRTTTNGTAFFRSKGCSSFNPQPVTGCYAPASHSYPKHCWLKPGPTSALTTHPSTTAKGTTAVPKVTTAGMTVVMVTTGKTTAEPKTTTGTTRATVAPTAVPHTSVAHTTEVQKTTTVVTTVVPVTSGRPRPGPTTATPSPRPSGSAGLVAWSFGLIVTLTASLSMLNNL